MSAFCLAAAALSCNDAFLECPPRDEMTDANFWQTEEHVKSVANTFTASLQGKYWLNITEIMADSAPWAVTTAFRTIGAGNYTTETSQINSIWTTAYTNIGKTNYFLNNYPGYRIKKSEYVEDFSGDNYYRLIIAMKGVGQTEYEMIFDPRGKLTKTNAPDPDFVKKDYIARLNPEAIEYRQKKMAERASLDGSGLEIRTGEDGDVKKNSKSKDVDIEAPEALDVPVIPDEVTKAFKKKFPRLEVNQWKEEDGNYRAYYENRGRDMEMLFAPDGMVMTTTTAVEKERYPRLIIRDLSSRYPEVKFPSAITKFQKVDYDLKYRKTVTDRKLDTYYYIEFTQKIKGKKDKKTVKLTYDKSFKYQGLAGSTDEYQEEE